MATIYYEPFASLPAVWENTTTEYSTPRDGSYPYVSAVKKIDLQSGTGPFGGNVASCNDINAYISFDSYGPWDATAGNMQWHLNADATIAATLPTSSYTKMAELKPTGATSAVGSISLLFRVTSISGSTMTGTWRVVHSGGYINVGPTDGGTITLGTWQRYTITWRCGSNPVDNGLFTPPTVDSDGSLLIEQANSDGSGGTNTLFDLTNIPMFVNPGSMFGATINYNNHSELFTYGDFAEFKLFTSDLPIPGPMQRASYVFFSNDIVEKQMQTRLTRTFLQLLTADAPASTPPASLTLTNIVGTMYDSQGNAVTSGKLYIKPKGIIQVSSTYLISAQPVTYTITGAVNFYLAPSTTVTYTVEFDPDPADTRPRNLKSGYWKRTWTVPNVTSVNISEL